MTLAPLLRTPLHPTLGALGAKFVPFAGWEMPIQFAGLVAEHHAVRERAGLFDVSHMGRLRITGPSAVAAVDRLITNALESVADGKAVYTCCCSDAGTILDDLICYRESAESVFVICNASNHDKIAAHFSAELSSGHLLTDVTDATGLLALQGPLSLQILESLGVSTLRPAPRMAFVDSAIAGCAVTIALTGYTGELGVEIVCKAQEVVAVYGALLEAGRPLGMLPAGLGCRDTLRLEARLSLYGNEIDETTTPLEAGLGWTVKLDKPDFVGRSALLAARARGLGRTLVGLEMLGRGIARHGYPIQSEDGRVVGSVTSGSPSPTLGKNIALGYVPVELATVGTRLLVDCRGKLISAQVVPTPFYKRSAV